MGHRGQGEAGCPQGTEGVWQDTSGDVGLGSPRLSEGVGQGRAVVNQKLTTWACLPQFLTTDRVPYHRDQAGSAVPLFRVWWPLTIRAFSRELASQPHCLFSLGLSFVSVWMVPVLLWGVLGRGWHWPVTISSCLPCLCLCQSGLIHRAQ